MKTINLILSIGIILVIIALLITLFAPYFIFTPKALTINPNPQPEEVSLMEFVWLRSTKMEDHIAKQLKEAGEIKRLKDYDINDYVYGLVGTVVFAIIAVVSLIFGRKSIFGVLACVAWAVTAIKTFYTPNALLALGDAPPADRVIQTCGILAIAGAVLILLRVYPWIRVRILAKREETLALMREHSC